MLKIRLRRMGARNAPFYRVVVSDSRKFPTAAAIEEIGFYDTRVKPSLIKIDHARVDHWVSQGAQLSKTVRELVARGNTHPDETQVPAEAAAAAEAPAEAAVE